MKEKDRWTTVCTGLHVDGWMMEEDNKGRNIGETDLLSRKEMNR